MAEASGAGALIEVNKIPVLSVTKKIANALNIDPYRLISSGSLIITTSNGKSIVEKLEEAGIKATIIGKIVRDEKTKAVFDNRKEVITVRSDELFKLEV